MTTENAGDEEFYEVAFPGTPTWPSVKLTALFEADFALQPMLDEVAEQWGDDGEIPVSLSKLVDQDWERLWLDSFKPVQVGHDLWVCPSWCEPQAPQSRNIILDPGLAFGTGTHATTGLCLQWLSEQDLSQQTVLDYGAGSGILAIAALICGANQATAVDIDPLAVSACHDNAVRNQTQDKLRACLPNELEHQPYDLVIANILAEVLIELKETLLLHLRPTGTLLLTGILNDQADNVMSAYADSLAFEHRAQDQWSLLIGTALTESRED